jgi:hypothetical protein
MHITKFKNTIIQFVKKNGHKHSIDFASNSEKTKDSGIYKNMMPL